MHAEAVSAIRRSARRSPGEYWALTRAGRARLRDRRLSDIRAFADSNGWHVLGLHQDLSVRHPVPPLLGAVSAQDELAVAGTWEQWPALVASVLVQPAQRRPGSPRQRDLVVQLTTLDTGPLPGQFTAAVHGDRAEVVELSRTGALMAEALRSWLDDAPLPGTLQPGDHMAADEVDLLHARTLGDGRARIDIEGPLHALASLARLLQADRRPGQP